MRSRLGNVVHGRADIDGGAVIERQALLAAFISPMLQGRLIHVPVDGIVGARHRLTGRVQ